MNSFLLAYKGAGTFRKLGGQGHSEVDSFHATLIGVMLKSENVGGRCPFPPPVSASMLAKVCSVLNRSNVHKLERRSMQANCIVDVQL